MGGDGGVVVGGRGVVGGGFGVSLHNEADNEREAQLLTGIKPGLIRWGQVSALIMR